MLPFTLQKIKMYKEHPVFIKPNNEDSKIWRYLDFPKFISLLDRKSLFFVRASELCKVDPYEGHYTFVNIKKTIEKNNERNSKMREKYPQFFSKQNLNFNEERTPLPLPLLKTVRMNTALNYWYLGEHETDAMWKLYSKNGEGIAIQSTFKRLKECFETCLEMVYIGMVQYIDYEKEEIPEDNLFYPFLHKRTNLKHECELRALVQNLPEDIMGEKIQLGKLEEPGVYIPISLDNLIEKAYVAPTSPRWHLELVENILNKYGLKKEVKQSILSEPPPHE